MRVLASIAVALTAVVSSAGLSTGPFITSVSPLLVRPSGGEVVTMTGLNFRAPVRVVVDFGRSTKDAVIVSQTKNEIRFLTPPSDKDRVFATITLFTEAGTPNESRTNSFFPLYYQNLKLTPSIEAVLPSSGPLLGATRVSIFGTGFEAPVQVFFGDQEAQVVQVSFFEIVAIAPAGRAIGPVDVRVVNAQSGTNVVAQNAFRYAAGVQITSVSPNTGPSVGGTRVRIEGSGFDVPVLVMIAGVPALPIRVTSTEIIAITTPTIARPCNATGPVTVQSIVNGDSATGPSFTYVCSPRRRTSR